MLLGTTAPHNTAAPETEALIIQLLLQQRYAEAYELLDRQQPAQRAALYNMALCLHWSGNHREALSRLEKIQLARPVGNSAQLEADSDYKQIKSKQNETDDHLQGMSEAYINCFPALAQEAIVRLKTDCWLQLGNYAKVIAVATPIAHKGYRNITEALQLAGTAHDK